MKLTALKYGRTEITESMAFVGGDEKVKLPISLLFFLIETEGRKILVDVGCDTMPGFELFEFKKPVDVLEDCGISRREITDIIITHAHHDHIDALRHYPQAKVYLHKDGLKYAEGFLAENTHLTLLDGDALIAKNVKFKHIGGHLDGSGIVLIENGGKTYVLCGDECYTKENLLHKKPTGSSFHPNESRRFVEEYSKESYIPILFHDPDLVSNLGGKVLFD